MSGHKAWSAAIAGTVALGLAACGGPGPPGTPSRSGPIALRHALPPGFSASRQGGLPAPPAVLKVTPATNLQPRSMHPGTFPRSSVPSLAQAIVNQPVPTLARPLLVSTALRPGEDVIVAAGDLPSAPPHDAMFILQGPDSRAQRLVQVSRGVAAGVVTIPASLSSGTWVLAAEDLSQLRALAARRPRGSVYLDLAVFRVS